MTVIVGLVDGDDVWIGADGRASFGYYQMPLAGNMKMGRLGPMLIGTSGMPRTAQILLRAPDVPELGQYAPMDYLCGPFARWARALIKENDSMGNEAGMDNTKSHFLMGLCGRLFLMDGLFAVYESARGFEACGTGLEVALGYLIATPKTDARARIQGALEAAAEVLPGCGPPFFVEKL